MGSKKDTKKINYEGIKAVASDLFASNGYANTSMNDIADILNIKKASLYHHIQTREQLLIDIIKDIEQSLQDAFSKIKGFTEHSEQKKIFMKLIKQFYWDSNTAYLMLKLSCETSLNNILNSINKFIEAWIKQFTLLLTPKCAPQLAKETAEEIIYRLLGTLIHSKLSNKKLMIKKILQDINKLLD